MTTPPVRLRYPSSPIYSHHGLSRALGVPVDHLRELAARSDSLYRLAKPITKADGTVRQPFDALPPLKSVHRKIQQQFLGRVQFPDFLTGSLKGRDAIRNARIHANARIVVCEDIAQFFPSTSDAIVLSVWKGFFGFGPDASSLLTALTTKDGALPQGAITSSYLANLVFWRKEEQLRDKLAEKGIMYSRYVDDIAMSAKHDLTKAELTWCIAQVYGMMLSCGLKAKRGKQEIYRSNERMITTKLVVNKRPALLAEQRHNIRAGVHQLAVLRPANGDDISRKDLNSIRGKVVRLTQLHPTEGRALKRKLSDVKPD